MFHPGDYVIFRADKHSPHPGPRARDVRPERFGEGYTYVVDKFWVVKQADGSQIVALTRTGKLHELDASDPRLQRARWWQKLLYRSKFPKWPDEGAKQTMGT
jgi:hypothetical protein